MGDISHTKDVANAVAVACECVVHMLWFPKAFTIDMKCVQMQCMTWEQKHCCKVIMHITDSAADTLHVL